MKQRRITFPLLVALGAAAAGAGMAACTASFDAAADVQAGSTVGGGGSGAAGGEAPDGSIDVTADGSTRAPLDYAGLCALDQDACIPGPASEKCLANGTGGAMGGTSCQLVVDDGGTLAPECNFPGGGAYNDPCTSVTNCGAGLGCAVVGDPSSSEPAAACRTYCCGDLEECPKDTYCTPQPMVESTDVAIPVCIPATHCTLLDDSTCLAGQTCTIVRADGTTSCVEPGTAKEGEGCQTGLCAPGYTCLKLVNQCKKLCHVDQPADCPGGACIGGSGEYPDGFGTCTEGDGYN